MSKAIETTADSKKKTNLQEKIDDIVDTLI